MREKQIENMMMFLEELWKRNPEMRLAELLISVSNKHDPGVGVYFKEDNDMQEAICKALAENTKFWRY